MNELQLIKTMKGDEYRLWKYLSHIAGLSKGQTIWGITREHISAELGIGINKTYELLKTLKEKGFIEYNGAKQFVKVLHA